jgi:transposase-like protein
MTEKQRKQKIYNANSIVALARYLGVTSQTVHGWKRGAYKKDGEVINNERAKLKFGLIMSGWQEKCKQELK